MKFQIEFRNGQKTNRKLRHLSRRCFKHTGLVEAVDVKLVNQTYPLAVEGKRKVNRDVSNQVILFEQNFMVVEN